MFTTALKTLLSPKNMDKAVKLLLAWLRQTTVNPLTLFSCIDNPREKK